MSSDTAQAGAPQVTPPRDRWAFVRSRTCSRWTVRVLALVGVALIVLNLTAWWLTTRVLDDNGFRDVITKSAQRPAVRSYIAEQATLRFAKSNKLVTAARPVVSKAVAEAIGTPPVTQAIHAFAAGAHSERRAKVAAATASATIRSTLQSIDPALAEKLPDTR